MRDSFQVHLFDDLGVEMLSESGGCMCLNHCKKQSLNGFIFSTYSRIECPEGWYWVSLFMVLGALRAVCVVLEGPGNMLEF